MPAPRITGAAQATGSARPTPNPYEPRAYRSRAYRGDPFQARPLAGPAPRRPNPPPVKPRGRARWGRALFIVVVLLGLLGGCGAIVGYLWARGVDDNLKREDAFATLGDRPPKLVGGTVNILLLGTDSRDPDASGEAGGDWRTDTIVILHIPADHQRAYLISVPRDLYVRVPRSADGQSGTTMAKINAAYAWGGLPLIVQTVENYTGVRMDHVALVDFAGFVKVTDILGGVEMTVEQDIVSIHPPYRGFTAGTHHFNGEEALDYVRQRYQFTDGDFARMRHQQMFLKALLDKAASLGTLSSVNSLRDFAGSLADTMTVDQDFSLVDLAWQLHGLRGDDLIFMVNPNRGTAAVGEQSVVMSDRDRARDLYQAMAHDRLGEWVSAHGTGW